MCELRRHGYTEVLRPVTKFTPTSVGHWATAIVWLYVPYYLFVSIWRVYGQGRWWTFSKMVVLSLAYLFGSAFTLGLTGLYSVFSD